VPQMRGLPRPVAAGQATVHSRCDGLHPPHLRFIYRRAVVIRPQIYGESAFTPPSIAFCEDAAAATRAFISRSQEIGSIPQVTPGHGFMTPRQMSRNARTKRATDSTLP
jgi:hypothetical protein